MPVTPGAYFNQSLKDALSDISIVGDVRGEGIMAAVEFVKDKDSRTFFDPADKIGYQVVGALLERHKVIGRAMPQGDILGFAPPLCLSREESDTIVAAAKDAIETVVAKL